ncbi:hypothetical protein DNTS_029332 [Danionella cerebrum]|uniref:Uncharacterized protein n=1 Tax=Danionella cerebrum TaxID=2873325 RepID=A0A553NJZ6_9TELE|nr:hypothetical protein DNTS_029332 [Danionella translucida]
MEDGQWQSDVPMMRGGGSDPDFLNQSESSQSPDENHNRLLEEEEEVEQGPRGGHRPLRQENTHNNGEDEDYDSSRVEDEEDEEMDSNSGAFSPELDGRMRDSPTSSPSPTVSEQLLSPEEPPLGDAASPLTFFHTLTFPWSLEELEEQGDHPLLPQRLHQIAEAFIAEENYERALRFLHLETLYHERLLANLCALQHQWEKRLSLSGRGVDVQRERDSDLDTEELEKLRRICRTHSRPASSSEQCDTSKVQKNSVIRETRGLQGISCSSGRIMEDQSPSEAQQELVQTEECSSSNPQSHQPPTRDPSSSSPADRVQVEENTSISDSLRDADAEPEEAVDSAQPQPDTLGPGALMDTGQDEVESVPLDQQVEEEMLKSEDDGEPPDVSGNPAQLEQEDFGNGVEMLDVLNVSMLDDMAKRIQVEEITPAAGLVSILKRRASDEGTISSTPAATKPFSKRKVRFQEPENGIEHDEVGGDSWLLLLLLCLATVVISVGGTALYCTFGDAQSSVCTDFSHNMDIYMGRVQRGMDELKHWLSSSS